MQYLIRFRTALLKTCKPLVIKGFLIFADKVLRGNDLIRTTAFSTEKADL